MAIAGDIMQRFAKSRMDLVEYKTYDFKGRLSSDQVVFQLLHMKESDEIKKM